MIKHGPNEKSKKKNNSSNSYGFWPSAADPQLPDVIH